MAAVAVAAAEGFPDVKAVSRMDFLAPDPSLEVVGLAVSFGRLFGTRCLRF